MLCTTNNRTVSEIINLKHGSEGLSCCHMSSIQKLTVRINEAVRGAVVGFKKQSHSLRDSHNLCQ